MKQRLLILCAFVLAGCTSKPPKPPVVEKNTPLIQSPPTQIQQSWSLFTKSASRQYGVDEKLINAIIAVESEGNPKAVSKSNAIGLMQIKASTAGREVYRVQGRRGQPSDSELHDPARNIDIGTAYIRILQDTQLAGIRDPQTLQYATIVAYVNGAGALLRVFSSNRDRAIAMINSMSPEAFYQHIQKKHPASQAPRYLWKVTTAYRTI
ncbi:membrane-bound lytic murein transglycosylase EmtA [Enterobacteriaceae bacterium LUAb1]